MAGKVKNMNQIKQLLRMHRQGMGNKPIARALGMSKNTVKDYLDTIKSCDLDIDKLLDMDDPLLEKVFHPGNPSYKDPRYIYIETRLAHYVKELSRKGVTKNLLWQEYKVECVKKGHASYSYTQFCFHLNQLMVARQPSAVLVHKPGEKLYVDYAGSQLSYVDRQTGEIISCPVFVSCLPFSDYCFAWVCRNHTTEEFVGALVACLTHLGGVPSVLVPDNLKAAVIRANRYEPELNHLLVDFANHYGMTVIPARIAKPKDKALCENQVKLIYNRVYAHLRDFRFFDLLSLREAVAGKVRDHNQTRMQQKPYCRQERFLAEEQPVLKSLPENSFQIKYYRSYTVAKNGHIFLSEDRHYYSVPYRFVGQKVQVIYTLTLVTIYAHDKCIATHVRNFTPSGYTWVKEHLSSTNKFWIARSPDYYLERAGEKSKKLVLFFKGVFGDNLPPELHYRTCDGVLSLQRKTPAEVFERALDIALKNSMYSYGSMKNLIKNDEQNRQEQPPNKPLPKHDNVRGKEYYNYSFFDDPRFMAT